MTVAPKPHRFKVALPNDTLVEVDGWESSYTLGVCRGTGCYASVMLMSGTVLADGFATLEEAHAFNKLVLADRRRMFTGGGLDEFYARAGGREAAARVVEKLKALARKEA